MFMLVALYSFDVLRSQWHLRAITGWQWSHAPCRTACVLKLKLAHLDAPRVNLDVTSEPHDILKGNTLNNYLRLKFEPHFDFGDLGRVLVRTPTKPAVTIML